MKGADDVLRDRFRGALLGLMAGDALGMPVEGMSARSIERRHGVVRDMLEARLGRGTYTDDAQLMIGLAEGLLDAPGAVDLDRIAARFAENFDPQRGYGGNAVRILGAIRGGMSWRQAVERYRLPGGSFANGAAMRVAPVALAFFGDETAVAGAAERQAEVTGHSHPLGRFGARLVALAVHRAIDRGRRGEPFDAAGFVNEVIDAAPDPGAPGGQAPGQNFRGQAPEPFIFPLRWIAEHPDASPTESGQRLGVSGRADQSVPAALWAFASTEHSAEEAIVRAVNLGGDADTIGAMAGAMAGGFHGASALPARWLDALENEGKGRDYVIELADRLFDSLSTR